MMMYKLLPKSSTQIHDNFSLQQEMISNDLPPLEFLKDATFAAGEFLFGLLIFFLLSILVFIKIYDDHR